MTTAERVHECTQCGAPCIPIVYGMPGPELLRELRAGRVALGGCVIDDVMPLWRCPECGQDS